MTRLGREQWKKLVEELESSELTQKEFAAKHGVMLPTLQFWKYKLRRESRQESRPVILPVELVPSPALSARRQRASTVLAPSPAALVEVATPTGALLRFTAGTDVNYVRQLLAVLG